MYGQTYFYPASVLHDFQQCNFIPYVLRCTHSSYATQQRTHTPFPYTVFYTNLDNYIPARYRWITCKINLLARSYFCLMPPVHCSTAAKGHFFRYDMTEKCLYCSGNISLDETSEKFQFILNSIRTSFLLVLVLTVSSIKCLRIQKCEKCPGNV